MTLGQEKMRPSGATADLAVIVVGLNARDFVDQCWQTVKSDGANGLALEMIYIDNASADDSLEMMAREHPDVQVIVNSANLGFCKAANQGARLSTARHLCFINDDVIVLNQALETLSRFLDDHPDVGVVGARLLNVDKTDQWSGRRFPTMLNGLFARRSPIARMFPDAGPLRRYLYRDEIEAGEPFDADWVSAAGLVVRRDLFEQIGMFDESYYYWHEAVFCDRIARAGARVVLHTGARIIHYEGYGSGKRPPPVQRWHIRDFHRGALRCYLEHYQVGPYAPRALMTRILLTGRKTLLLGLSYFGQFLGRSRSKS